METPNAEEGLKLRPSANAYVSNERQQSSAGQFSWDHDPRLLSLTLKATFSEIGTIITLLREGLFTQFDFQVEPSGTEDGCDVNGWSGSFAL
jgi:hypothetical protein